MSVKHFFTANNELRGKKLMWLKAKSKAKLKPESRRKGFRNTLISNVVLVDIKLLRYKAPMLLQRAW